MLRFTLAQLEAFYWIGRLGRFQFAARQLNLAQPTISLRIRELERSLGTSLLERAGRNVRLTNEGEILLELSSSILQEAHKINESVGAAGVVQGTFRLGLPEFFAITCLPDLLRNLGRDHERLRVELAIGTSANLARELEERRLDAAIVTNPQMSPGLQYSLLAENQMVWAASSSQQLKEPVGAGDICGFPIFTNPRPEPQYQMIVDWFSAAGLAPLNLSICTSVAVTAELVASGVGMSLLPLSLVQPHVTAGRIQLLALRQPIPAGRLFFCYHASDSGSNVTAVHRAVRDVMPKLE